MAQKNFEERLKEHAGNIHAVVPFTENDRLLLMDFTHGNSELTDEMLADTVLFSDWVNLKLLQAGARYGIGGYDEHRTIYSRSAVFGPAQKNLPHEEGKSFHPEDEPRRLHLGVDIWGDVATPVMAPLEGLVHSFNFNDAFGDYGATLILEHNLDGLHFHTLYGHLSLNSIRDKKEGQAIEKGEVIAAFGPPEENGQWPPHLHFQLILDLQGMKGDYPGVCKFSERAEYLANCPDPEIILKMIRQAY